MLRRKLLYICLGALGLRLLLLPMISHPGIADSNHYYNLGIRLVEGHGFTIDYIWQYNNPPDNLIHPEDYWMPLNGLIVAAAMKIFGISVHAALVPFILLGSLVPLIAYWGAKQFNCSEMGCLFAAGVAGVIPEFVLNSLRTDTTIPNIIFVCLCIILLIRGLRHGGIWAFVGSGVMAGLAYQLRSENALLLPMLIVTLTVYWFWGRGQAASIKAWRYAILIPLIAFGMAVPWALRNLQISGTPTTPKLEYMFFLTDFREHYVYRQELSLQTYLSSQSLDQLIGKRLFEMAATIKLMVVTLGSFLPVAVSGGLLLILIRRDRDRLLTLAPTLILLGGIIFFYTVLVPLKSQGGSMKKAYITLIPLLLPMAAYALEEAIPNHRIRLGTMILVIGLLVINAYDLVRNDSLFANQYLREVQTVATAARSLPDTNGDGEITLMSQDPFILRFLGIRSAMIPMEDRDTILEVARRYDLDYLLMPADRPSLDPLYYKTEVDPRYIEVFTIPGTTWAFYSFDFGA